MKLSMGETVCDQMSTQKTLAETSISFTQWQYCISIWYLQVFTWMICLWLTPLITD